MIHDYLKPLTHYAAIGVLLCLTYFLGSSLIDQMHKTTYHGPQVVVTAPTPNAVGQVAQDVANLAEARQIYAAIHGENIQLSAAQQTVANAVSAFTGASSRMAGAAAAGLTTAPPQRQVIEVTSKTDSAKFAPSPASNDDAIKRDLKEVLATTALNVHSHTDVNVKWEDKKFSPVSAVYGSDGGSGLGISLHKAPALSLNALGLVSKGKPEVGFDFEHIFKGTSAGLGVGAVYNLGGHRTSVEATVHFHS